MIPDSILQHTRIFGA